MLALSLIPQDEVLLVFIQSQILGGVDASRLSGLPLDGGVVSRESFPDLVAGARGVGSYPHRVGVF